MSIKFTKILFSLFLFGLLGFILQFEAVNAEPYLAMRTGYKCSQCHNNQSGGGKRTGFGVIYAQTRLYMRRLGTEGKPVFFSGRMDRFISVGANVRFENVSLFKYENILTEENSASNNNRIPEANLYFLFELVPDALSIYADQTLAPGNANRELFGLLQNLPLNSYFKVGRMLLPYGLRLRDDEAFIRNETGYTYNKHDTGAEIGLEPGPFSLIANVTQNQFSVVGSTVFRRFRIGGSYARNTTIGNDYVFGAFAGANFGRFTLLGEGDLITRGGVDRFAGLAEINLLLSRGLNLKTTYEFFDRNRDIPNARDGQERFTLGVEPFLTQFMQLGIFYRFNRFIPQNAQLNRDQLFVQFHFFF
ncbi:MAG: hypothetical protein ACE5IR_21950 [bacterium]